MKNQQCGVCGQAFDTPTELYAHRDREHSPGGTPERQPTAMTPQQRLWAATYGDYDQRREAREMKMAEDLDKIRGYLFFFVFLTVLSLAGGVLLWWVAESSASSSGF